MSFLLSSILSVLGPGKLLGYVWQIIKPTLQEWAKDDNKVDWDDELVLVLDDLIGKISKDIK